MRRSLTMAGAYLTLAAFLLAAAGAVAVPLVHGQAVPATAEWTILVYMHADNNFEGPALLDLEEMARVGSRDRVHVVVQIDRRDDPDGDWAVLNLPDWTSTKRLRVERGRLRELADPGELDMDDPQTLAEFIAWGAQAFPAKRYGLVLWNHGGVFMGFGGDESAGEGSIMSIPVLAAGLAPDADVTTVVPGLNRATITSLVADEGYVIVLENPEGRPRTIGLTVIVQAR